MKENLPLIIFGSIIGVFTLVFIVINLRGSSEEKTEETDSSTEEVESDSINSEEEKM